MDLGTWAVGIGRAVGVVVNIVIAVGRIVIVIVLICAVTEHKLFQGHDDLLARSCFAQYRRWHCKSDLQAR